MKVLFTIWILAVLIQEVIPSTLVRLPRHAEKNLSLVHTEYEAKYEQKGKHGNESFSSVSGKQEIVHDNCAENWNSFAEKCASLIKDLVASLANAVSSKPGDATNLQLHIKNTFRHFDNTHNCTCLNHTGKTLSDLNLSPLFKNITINTVGSSTKTNVASGSGAKYKKCGGKLQPCDEGNDSDAKEDKNIMVESPFSNGLNGQPLAQSSDEHDDKLPIGNFAKSKIFDEKLAEEQKQQNRALVDAEDLDMNPENAEGSSDQTTNNSRRQIKYPQNLMKPHKISKNSGDSDLNPLAEDLKHSSSNPKRPKGVGYPFLVTPRPNSQSAKPIESLSGPSLENDFPNSPIYEPSHVLLSEENSSASTAVPSHSSSVKSNGVPSSASNLLTSPNNGNLNPNNNYLGPAPQIMTEPRSSFYKEEDPKEEVLPSNNLGSYQKSISLPAKSMNNRNNQPPAIISEEPFKKDYNSEPAVLVPAKSVNNKLDAQSPVVLPDDQLIYNSKSESEVPVKSNPQLKQILPEKPLTDSQTLNPIEQLESDQKLVPTVLQPKKPISDSKSSGQPTSLLSEPPLFVDGSDGEVVLPVKPISSEAKTLSSLVLPEKSFTGSPILKPEIIPEEQVKSGPDAISSPITKPSQQKTVIPPEKPETEDYTSNLPKLVPDDYKTNINWPATISAVPVESIQSVPSPGELSLPKTIKSETSELIPKNSAGSNYNSEPSAFMQNKMPEEKPANGWSLFTPKTYDLDKTSKQGNTEPVFTMNVPEEDQEALKGLPLTIPVTNSGKNFPQSSEPQSDVITLNSSPIYKPSSPGSSSNPLAGTIAPGKNPAILSPEDILPVEANGQPLTVEQSMIKSPIYKPSSPGSSSNSMAGTVAPGKNPAILSPEDILPVEANGQPLAEEQSMIKSPIYKPSSPGSSSNPLAGTVAPGKNPAILSPEDILPVEANGQPLTVEQSMIKSPIYKPSSPGSSSNSMAGTVALGKNPAILSPEDILPVEANGQPLAEEQSTTECDQTTGDGLYHKISMIKPTSTAPKVANQQSGITAPIEKQISDKSNELIVQNSQLIGNPIPVAPESILSQKPSSSAQYTDTRAVNSPMEKLQYPQQSIQEKIFTTPLPFYPVKTVTESPVIGQKLNPQPAGGVEAPEIYESQGKDFSLTEIPTASNIPGASISKDQLTQSSIVPVGGSSQNGEQIITPVVASEIAATTPVIIYPIKALPISSESPEQSYQESSHPAIVNTGFSNGDQKPEVQSVSFSTPVPISPVKPIQVVPVTAEQQNGSAGSPMQLTATTESCLASNSLNEEEHYVTYAPVRESDNVQYSQVNVKPDKTPAQLARPNFDDHPQSATELNSLPSSISNSKTTPVISSEPQPEIIVPPTPLKPAQPGVLIQNTEALPQQEEDQNLLLTQPTTFQTTSEDPTPSQVNIPGLLTHTTSVPQDSDETMSIKSSTSPKTTSIYEHDEDDEEDCCSCESCTEEEITDPKQYKETACKNLEEARKELKAIFDKIKKKLKCGRKAPQTITSS